MGEFSNRKYSGHITTDYRLTLIELHLNEAKKHLSPVPDQPWLGNAHLSTIAILGNTDTSWNLYRAVCSMYEIPSYKPVIE